MESMLRMLTLEFYTSTNKKKYKYPIIKVNDDIISISDEFQAAVQDEYFKEYVLDVVKMNLIMEHPVEYNLYRFFEADTDK